jgi:hypothetical protein
LRSGSGGLSDRAAAICAHRAAAKRKKKTRAKKQSEKKTGRLASEHKWAMGVGEWMGNMQMAAA